MFGIKLKEIRNKRGFSLRQLARQAHVNYSFISQLENGKRNIPKPSTLKKLAHGLRVPYAKLSEIAGYAPKIPDNTNMVDDMVRIPVIGSIHCGEPIDAPQNVTGYQPFPTNVLNPGHKYFIMNCVGHSMEPQITNGAKVLCKKQKVAENGQIVAVEKFDDTDCTCALKRYHHHDNSIILTPDNPAYSGTTIYINKDNAQDYQIVGVVSLILTKPHKPII